MMSNVQVGLEMAPRVAPRLYPPQNICKRIYQGTLIFADTAMLVLACGVAYWLRFHMNIAIFEDVDPNLNDYINLAWVLLPTWFGLFSLLRLYELDTLLGGTREYTRVLNGCTSGMMLVVIASFLNPSFLIARGWLFMMWLLACILICGARLGLRRAAYRLRSHGYFVSNALIIGTNQEAISLAAQLRHSIYSGVTVLGYISEYETGTEDVVAPTALAGLPVLGALTEVMEIIDRQRVEEVIIATTALSREQRLNTVLNLTEIPDVKLSFSSGLYEILTTGMQVNTRNSVPLLSMNRLRLDPLEMTLKTVLDYTIILLAAPTLLLLFGVIALLIKLDSPGSVLYRRRVLGIGGVEFDAFKFRTMVVNGDQLLQQYPEKVAELKATHKLKDDPRITRVGKWLRKTSLDELPQLINVCFGQMSLVGPRMIHPDETSMYGPYKSNLLTVKPGLTGLWQVSGRSDISYEARVHLDMHYIRNYSIWMDLHILFFKTVPAVFAKRGAY